MFEFILSCQVEEDDELAVFVDELQDLSRHCLKFNHIKHFF